MAKFSIYKDAKGEFRWRLSADNSKIIADSGEGYKNKSDCKNGIEIVKKESSNAPVSDLTPSV